MKNIHFIEMENYKNSSKYEFIEKGIYKTLFEGEGGIPGEGDYVSAFSFTLEEGEDTQYPLEDILDKYYAHVSDFIQMEAGNPIMKLELCTGDDLECMKKLKEIIGKRIYNEEYIDKADGKTYIRFKMEEEM